MSEFLSWNSFAIIHECQYSTIHLFIAQSTRAKEPIRPARPRRFFAIRHVRTVRERRESKPGERDFYEVKRCGCDMSSLAAAGC